MTIPGTASNDGSQERLDALVLDYQSGALTAERLAELDGLLRTDAQARARFAHWCEHAVVLREVATMAAEARDTARRPSRQLPAARSSRRGARGGRATSAVITFRRVWIAAAAALILALGTGAFYAMSTRASIADGCVLARASSGVVFSDPAGDRPASSGDRIAPGQALSVPTGGSAEVAYADGSRVELASGTRAVLLSLRDGLAVPCIELGSGALTATISHQPTGRPLEVRTQLAKLTVIGTVFSLEQRSYGSCLSVREGKVRIERLSDGAAVDVPAGMAADAGPEINLVARSSGGATGQVATLFHQDFAHGLPPGWDKGTLVEPGMIGFDRPAVRAVHVAVPPKNGVKGERLNIHSQVLDDAAVPFRDDAWLHLTYRMKHKGNASVELFMSFFDANNTDVAEQVYFRARPAGQDWITLDLPLADVCKKSAKSLGAGSHLRWWLLDSYHSDCEVEVAEISITTGTTGP